MTTQTTTPLTGRRILLVEDDYLLADALAQSLRSTGALVSGPIGTVDGALAAVDQPDDIEAVVLDEADRMFDLGFINAEFARTGHGAIPQSRIVDTLALARRKHPGAANSLDALCSRYGIDTSRRVKHGALLDSELLAEVYIELIGGKQTNLGLVIRRSTARAIGPGAAAAPRAEGPGPAPGRREGAPALLTGACSA